MTTLLSVLTAFRASLCWGILFSGPRRRLFFAGLVGSIGWAAWLIGESYGLATVGRTLVGAVCVGIAGEVFARLLREPATVFLISGIVPLVPGVGSYNSMQAFVVGDYLLGISLAAEALLAAGAIAIGLALATSLARGAFSLARRSNSR